ncbi:MAG: EAL domain-containing protein [Lachnospiraceae bacterium]|nr:EAL domain-containing protein [Lachnospiraceae bacterium]
MAERKRIALLLGQAEEFYQRRFIDGFLKQTFKADLDVCVFSMFLKYQDTEARERGDTRIYSLINFSLFDAVVVLPDTIQTPGTAQMIEERIKKEFDGPVLYVDLENSSFPYILTDSYTPVKQLIEHLVKVHGYRDIAYLTGKKKHEHSKIRLQAYRDVMNASGLTVREDRIFYGDYWYTSGKTCAEELLKNRDDLPEAVACANDFMAIGLCEELTHHGIRIPEDIAVIGFDTSEEGQRSPSPLTSAYIPARSTGKRAAESIIRLMHGETIDESPDETDLFIGTSCGCADNKSLYENFRRKSWSTTLSEEGFHSMHNHFIEDMLAQKDLLAFWDTVYSHVYQIKDFDSFHLCIPTDWDDSSLSDDETLSTKAYPDQMIHALASYRGGGRIDRVGHDECFDTSILLPEIYEPHEKPSSFFFTPLYFGARNFGYAVISYGNLTICYDEIYRQWMQAFCCGMEGIRRTLLTHALRRVESMKGLKTKFPSGFTSEPVVSPDITEEDEESLDFVRQILDENLFTYHFQPIVSAFDGSIYAFEALMRVETGKRMSPLEILKYANMLRRLPDVEKATFMNVLEQMAKEKDSFGDRYVFINSIPGTRLSESDEKRIEELLLSRNNQAVVELTEQAELNDRELDQMKKRFNSLGIDTAVDDFGTGYSNISNLLRYMPNYVKVDRSLLSNIQDSRSRQHLVREIVSFSHDANIKVLAEGVETSDELRTVISLGCDLIQGFYTGRPSPEIPKHIAPEIVQEICFYQRERQEGSNRRSYRTGRSNRLSAGSLEREGYQILVTTGDMTTFRDYTLSGTPGQNTELTIEIKEGYDGQITLENVSLVSPRLRPCIEIAPGAKVVLVLHGENTLTGGGILVPKGAELTVRGDGDLLIRMNQRQYAVIGTSKGSAGRMEFCHEGTILLDAGGTCGVGIGGMTGADIRISSGKFVIQQRSDQAAGIGSIEGEVIMEVSDCDIDMTFSGTSGVGIGSLSNDAALDVSRTYFHCSADSGEYTAIGSLRGSLAKVLFADFGTDMEINAHSAAGTGALNGYSEIVMIGTNYRYTGNGALNYAFGSANGNGSIKTRQSNINAHANNDSGRITELADDDKR